MKTMHRLGLTALALAVGTLFIASPAKAGKNALIAKASVTEKLTPPAMDAPEPNASGKCTLQWVGADISPVEVAVSCRGLTPGNQYCVVVHEQWFEAIPVGWGWMHEAFFEHPFTADAKGQLKAEFNTGLFRYQLQDLWVENEAGEVVLVEQWR